MEFIEGKWYAVGWKQDDGRMDYQQIIRYEGDGCWSDDDGEEVTSLFDPILQLRIGVDGADDYALQA